jgi:hypothetical protein
MLVATASAETKEQPSGLRFDTGCPESGIGAQRDRDHPFTLPPNSRGSRSFGYVNSLSNWLTLRTGNAPMGLRVPPVTEPDDVVRLDHVLRGAVRPVIQISEAVRACKDRFRE